MTQEISERGMRRPLRLRAAVVVAAIGALLPLSALHAAPSAQVAQATPSPSASPEPSPTPAEAKPGGTRPTTPAPEPARPDAEAVKEGAKPALPPAPAEKVAPPMEKK